MTSNDTDPDGDLPLSVTGLQWMGGNGNASAGLQGGGSVDVYAGDTPGTTYYQYTVTDNRGASATGSFTITTTGNRRTCSF